MTGADRVAVIEAGSKGIRLLVVERRRPPEGMSVLRSLGDLGFLGEGLEENQGHIRPENVRLSLSHIQRFLELAHTYEPGRVVLVGTEVFRRAANVDDFRARLPSTLQLRVLAPEEEAVGSFLAASWGFRHDFPPGGQLELIDLGGGSLQLVGGVQGSPASPRAVMSFGGMGTLVLHEVWQRCPEVGRRDETLRRHIEDEIDQHAADFASFRASAETAEGPRLVAGLGSTITESAWALADRPRRKYSSERVHGLTADVQHLDQLRRLLLGAPSSVPDEWGITDLVGNQLGLAALLAVLRRLNVSTITACGTGLRFGLAYAFLHDIPLCISQ